MKHAIQLKIVLDNSRPSIWRRIIVSPDITFFELHHIFQITMGWANYHLFEFKITGYRIGEVNEEFTDYGFGDDQLINCRTTVLNDILSGKKETFTYYYDFGDNWTHSIKIEKLLDIDDNHILPKCIKGKLNCPPEDCGGVNGFYDFLKIIANKKHKEHKSTLKWIGGYYDSEEFDLEIINENLRHLKNHIKE
jgi:hypothetical protein